MNWIMLSWASIAFVVIVISVHARRDALRSQGIVRPHIDDIPFRPNHYRHSDDDHQPIIRAN
jgi:hypothetical protein